MEVDDLIMQLTSPNPDFQAILKVLHGFPELINGIIWENASVLHVAARNDVIHGTCILPWIVNHFKVRLNYSNEGGSVPILWALAAYQECKSKNKAYNLESIAFLLNHQDFNIKKTLLNRGILEDFISKHYPDQEISDLVQAARHKRFFPLSASQQESKPTLV